MIATLGIIQSSRPTAIPLLDTYTGAAAAYSLRKLSTAYTGSAIRVRRSSDNTEQDIGFDNNGNLSETSLSSFVGYQNLLAYSEQFDNAYWSKTRLTVTANAITAPDGTLTADKGENTNGAVNNGGYVGRISSISTSSGQFTFSIYVKAGTGGYCFSQMGDGTNYMTTWFNVTTGTVGSTIFIGSGWTSTSSNITSFGDGWYRCSITGTRATTTQLEVYFQAQVNGDTSYTATAVGSYNYFWGSQINTGSIQNYQVTTSSARDGMGYVTKWYDQSGNNRDALQSTSANQPRIVNAGTTDKLNSKPTIVFDGINDYLSLPTISSSASNYSFISILENKSSANSTFYLFDSAATRIILALRYNGYISFYDTQWKQSSNTLGLEKIILTYTLGSNCNIYKNGTNILSTTYSQEKIDGLTTLGTVYDAGGNFINATLSEFIIYSSDQSTNRTGIESKINSYYSIY